jgi:hypothetical protein
MAKSLGRFLGALCICLTAIFGPPGGAEERSPDKFSGRLYRCVFGYLPQDDPAVLDTKALPASLKQRFATFARRHKSFRSRLTPLSNPKAFPESVVFVARKRTEQAIVALVDAPGIEEMAAAYAGRAILAYEWEGMSDGPLREAGFAEDFLRQHPETRLRPYLLLFLAHRYRCAFETLTFEKKFDERPGVVAKYHRSLEAAR